RRSRLDGSVSAWIRSLFSNDLVCHHAGTLFPYALAVKPLGSCADHGDNSNPRKAMHSQTLPSPFVHLHALVVSPPPLGPPFLRFPNLVCMSIPANSWSNPRVYCECPSVMPAAARSPVRLLARRQAPQPDRAVPAPRGQGLAVRAE